MQTDQTQQPRAIWQPPVIPSKYDVIPIHNSDRASFKRCRRYWDWTSPARNNLSLRADIHGVNTDLFFGTGIHYALEQYYTPGLRRDPVESWKTWYDIQWRGGVVTADWLDKVYDLKPKPAQSTALDNKVRGFIQANMPPGFEGMTVETAPLWEVRGLEDIIPDADTDKFDELFELGVNMMQAYKGIADKYDGFEVLVAEHDFSVPIWDYENNCILKARDAREQSPNYGKLLEVHSRGRMDGIWQKPNGKLGIIDHKTSSRIDEDFFEKLETDEQCSSYLYAAEVEAQYYDLPYKGQQMEEVIYNVLKKAYPKPPTIVRGGLFSVDRQHESCTYELLVEWAQAQDPPITLPGMPGWTGDHPESTDSRLTDKHINYVEWLRDAGDEQFFVRKLVRRNRHQLKNVGYRIYLEALDMLDPNIRIYPNLRNDFQCLRCAFRSPCLMMEDGSDYEQTISDNYTRNKDR